VFGQSHTPAGLVDDDTRISPLPSP
jgi:hypothetical protein